MEKLVLDEHDITIDHAGVFETSHPTQRRRRLQANSVGEFSAGHSATCADLAVGEIARLT